MSAARSLLSLVTPLAMCFATLSTLPACEKTPETASSGLAPSTNPSSSAPAMAAAMTPATPEALALLGGLKPGEKLGSAEVAGVYGPNRGRLTVEIKDGAQGGRIEVALQGDGPLPPVTTAKYGVFFAAPVHGLGKLPDPKMMEACQALADRIKANELKAPTPPGLKSYGQRDMEL